MKQFWVLEGGVDYEGSRVISVYDTQLEADNICKVMCEWLNTKPQFKPGPVPVGADYREFDKIEDAWEKRCPLEGVCLFDEYYIVYAVPLNLIADNSTP